MSKKHRKHKRPRHDPEQRTGFYGGVYGMSYGISGGYLSPDQFGYTTAQADGLGDANSSSSSGGDAGGGAA